jgi:radical SAM superfamily enzyme YgiQ (UPF0313 family)
MGVKKPDGEIVLATINAKWIHPSLALRLLKANLGSLEDRAAMLEFALRQRLEEKTGPLLAAAPRVLGLSVSIWNHRATLELLETLEGAWKQGSPARPLVILGGPEVSFLPPEAAIFRHADWVVRGEGELVFRDLCALVFAPPAAEPLSPPPAPPGRPPSTALPPPEAVAALPSVRRVSGAFIEARQVDLAAIESGYRLYTGEDLRRKLIYLEASRGCLFRCAFCQGSGPSGVREFPLESFLGDMGRLMDRGGRAFKFLDRTFNFNIPRARRIMEFFLEKRGNAEKAGPSPNAEPSSDAGLPPAAGVKDNAPRNESPSGAGAGAGAGAFVHFEIFPSPFPPELRETLSRFPPDTLRLELGIQTFNRKTAALIKRPGDPETVSEILEFLRDKTQAIVHADLIAGLPGEDLASLAAGFDRLWRLRPREIQLGILKRLPGTPLARREDAAAVYSPDPPYEVAETGALSAAALDRVKNFARFWEIIVNRGAFADLVAALFPPEEAVFDRFMALSDWLLARFRRNWGIDRRELRAALEAWAASPDSLP